MKKKKTKINWNLITFIFSLLLFLYAIVLNWNQKEINILKKELEIERNKNLELEKNQDPNWYTKLNDQREYYENELYKLDDKFKDSLISLTKYIDSKKNYFTNTEVDSLYMKLIRLDYYMKIDSLGAKVIKNDSILIESYKSYSESLKNGIEFREELIKNKNHQLKLYKDNLNANQRTNLLNIVVYSLFLILLLLYYFKNINK